MHSIASNAPDPDGIIVSPSIGADGALGEPAFCTTEEALLLLHRLPEQPAGHLRSSGKQFPDGVAIGRIDADGKVNVGPVVPIDSSAGVPSELCWHMVSLDDRIGASATNFGYSNPQQLPHRRQRAHRREGIPAWPRRFQGDGSFRAINGNG